MYITTKVPDHQYDLGIKGQGQIYLKSILQLVTLTPLPILWRVYIFSTLTAYSV